MKYCCAAGCKETGGFLFPKDPVLRRKWAEAVGRKGPDNGLWMPSKHSVVCCKHFVEDDFIKNISPLPRLRKDLLPGTVPSVFNRTPSKELHPIRRLKALYTEAPVQVYIKADPDGLQNTDPVRDALEEDSCTDFVVSVEAEESEIDIPIEQIHSIKAEPEESNPLEDEDRLANPLDLESELIVKSEPIEDLRQSYYEEDPGFPGFLVKTELIDDDDDADLEPIQNVQISSEILSKQQMKKGHCSSSGPPSTTSDIQQSNPSASPIKKTHSKLPETSVFFCKVCNVDLQTRNRYNHHVNVTHLGGYQTNSKTNNPGRHYQCKWCAKVCFNVERLQEHLSQEHSEHYNGPQVKLTFQDDPKLTEASDRQTSTPTQNQAAEVLPITGSSQTQQKIQIPGSSQTQKITQIPGSNQNQRIIQIPGSSLNQRIIQIPGSGPNQKIIRIPGASSQGLISIPAPGGLGQNSKVIQIPASRLTPIPASRIIRIPASQMLKLQSSGAQGSRIIIPSESQSPFKIVSVKSVPLEVENTECGICKKVFDSGVELKAHVKIVHDPNKKAHYCRECPEVFFCKDQLFAHIMEAHRQPLKCKKCSRTFMGLKALNHHLEFDHVLIFQCKACRKMFFKDSLLKQHMEDEHNGEAKGGDSKSGENEETSKTLAPTLVCHLCHAAFVVLKHLRQHFAQNHRHHKMYECYDCREFFDQQAQMQAQAQEEKGKSQESPQTKEAATKLLEDVKQSTSSEAMDAKETDDTPDPVSTSRKRRSRCAICKRVFSSSMSLIKHMKRCRTEDQFDCEQCDQNFISTEKLQRHVDTEHVVEQEETKDGETVDESVEEVYECVGCQKSFDSGPNLNLHMKKCNQDAENSLRCFLCDKTFSNKVDLANHGIEEHQNSKEQVCTICFKTYRYGWDLRRHTKEVHGKKARQDAENAEKDQIAKELDDAEKAADQEAKLNAETYFVCVHCRISFTTRKQLKEHSREEHTLNKEGSREVCPYCLGFTTGLNMEEHMQSCPGKKGGEQTETETEEKLAQNYEKLVETTTVHKYNAMHGKFPCTQCTRMFRTELFARRHMKDIHKLIACSKPGVEGSLNCIECLETFEEWTELREHFDRLHEPERNFVCEICNKSFVLRSTLKNHIIGVHQSERPHKCSHCPMTFKLPRHVKVHTRSTHMRVADKPCSQCDQKFLDLRQLKLHIRAVHENKQVFTCEECNKSFTQKSYWKNHVDVIHKKINGFRCHICAKLFTTKQMLEYHLISPNVHHITNNIIFDLPSNEESA